MKMYSMEGFLYRVLNEAARKKDNKKVKHLGPYASLLQLILLDYEINPMHQYVFKERAPGKVLYRGLQADDELIEVLRERAPDHDCWTKALKCCGYKNYVQITLKGFTSTSSDEETARNFAFYPEI